MFSDAIGNLPGLGKFKDPSWPVGAWLCSLIVVAGWGSILLMGVRDPLGGIYTLFPLFGIANQLLAAIALTVVFTVLMKQGKFKWAWVAGVPLAWDLIVTLSASYQKIFSDNPKIGYFAQHDAFVTARDAGKIVAPGKTAADMDKVVFNTMIQGSLSIIYASLVIIVFVAAMVVCVKAVRAGGLPTSEAEDIPSKIFAPRSFRPTAAEQQVLDEWKEAGLDPTPVGVHH